MRSLTETDLVAQARREYPRDRGLFRARLDQLLIDHGFKAPPDDRPTVGLHMVSRTLGIALPDLVDMCKTRKVEAVRTSATSGNTTWRIPLEVFERMKAEHA